MPIPKTIHYCWFGGNEKPALIKKCIKSWRKHCNKYEIIEWNEQNFDLSSAPLYVRQAYENKKWAFVSDFVRLKVVYEYGGIYLDTDVEIIKNIDRLLEFNAFFGFDPEQYVSTGLGFGCVKGHTILEALMADYYTACFLLPDGSMDMTPCPVRNLPVFENYGVIMNDHYQEISHCVFLPSDFFCPKNFKTGEKNITQGTYMIHHFAASWLSNAEKKKLKQEQIRVYVNRVLHTPTRLLSKIIGLQKYESIKQKLRKND